MGIGHVHLFVPQVGHFAPHALEPYFIGPVFKGPDNISKLAKILLLRGAKVRLQAVAPLTLVHAQPRLFGHQRRVGVLFLLLQGAQFIGPARGVLATGHKAAGATAAEDAQPLFIVAARDAVGVVVPRKGVAAHAILPQIKGKQRRNFRLAHPRAAAHGKYRALAAALLQHLGQWANQRWEDYIGFVDMPFVNVDFIPRHVPMGD